jgi:hypothetical protein
LRHRGCVLARVTDKNVPDGFSHLQPAPASS